MNRNNEGDLPSFLPADVLALSGIMAFCALCMFWRWSKLSSLLSMDPAWWLHQAARFAHGEVPYRDYYWPYGPLSIAVLGYPLRWFGVRFDVAQITVNTLSLLVVALSYVLLRYFLPPALRFLSIILLIAVCVTALTYFSLFSLASYTPSVHVGAIGLLLLLWGSCRYLAQGRLTAVNGALLASGAWIACLAKQEPILASGTVLCLLAAFDRHLWFEGRTRRVWGAHYLKLGALCLLPPAIIYLALGMFTGFAKLSACLQGFGLATGACPWWPTGVGLLGVLAALGEAAVLVAVASLFDRHRWRRRLKNRYALLWIGALLGTVPYAIYNWPNLSIVFSGQGSLAHRLVQSGPALFSSDNALRPVLWVALFYLAFRVIRGLRCDFQLDKEQLKLLMMMSVPAVMGIRSLFGSVLVPYPEIPAIAYPFLLLAGPILLLEGLHVPYPAPASLRTHPQRIPVIVVASVMLLYSAIRLVGGYPVLLSDRAFTSLSTSAGPIRLSNFDDSAGVYRYVMANTSLSDTILEMPFGGGIHFATSRRSPVYSNLFFQLRPPLFIQMEDLRRLHEHPPEVVIVPADQPNLGTLYGLSGNNRCCFPRLVWMPDRPSSDPNYIFPFVRYIEQNYRIDRTIGHWQLWRPTDHAGTQAQRSY